MAVPYSEKWKRAIDLTGQRFGELMVTERAGTKNNHSLWKCLCTHCGSYTLVTSSDLRTGKSGKCKR